MYKRQEGANVKTCNESDNDSMKMCFKHKIRMKVDYKVKDIIYMFLP
jgi:hypothetical protein